MNDIIWQNCSKYSSHAELLIVHMGNGIPASLKLAEIIHSVFPSLLACQHTHNDWCTLIRTLREDHKMRGNYEKCEWKIEQYCALGGIMFCREYLIFSPSPPPNRLVKVNKIFSLIRHSVPQHQTGNKKSVSSIQLSSINPRANTFPTIFQFPWDF